MVWYRLVYRTQAAQRQPLPEGNQNLRKNQAVLAWVIAAMLRKIKYLIRY